MFELRLGGPLNVRFGRHRRVESAVESDPSRPIAIGQVSTRTRKIHIELCGKVPCAPGEGMIEEAPALEGTQKVSKVVMTKSDKLVLFASSLGTVFEWYDFLLVGALAAEISRHFFSGVNPAVAFIFTLLSFAAGF